MNIIERDIFKDLQLHLKEKEISLLVGPRQAGKTTLMFFLKQELEARGKRCLFLNLEIERDKKFFGSQDDLLQKIRLEIGEQKAYIFIDEIQRKENAGLFLKGLYDMNLPYKFIVSGSGSVELKEKIHESLAGRKRVFEINTLSFLEFFNFKTNYKYENKLSKFFSLEGDRTRRLLDEYLQHGGYPKVVLSNNLEQKIATIQELYQSYLEKDIVNFLGVQKGENFTNLVKIMASQIGNLVNVNELANALNLASITVEKYLWYMQKTFLINKVNPFFRNIRKEIVKSPVFYFYDLGMRNFASDQFNASTNMGFVFENFVFLVLKQKIINSATKINFWRTKDGAEVDFVMSKGEVVIPFEVKYKNITSPMVSRSFRSFLAKYNPPKAYIVHLGREFEEKIGKTKIFFVPFDKFCLLKLSEL